MCVGSCPLFISSEIHLACISLVARFTSVLSFVPLEILLLLAVALVRMSPSQVLFRNNHTHVLQIGKQLPKC